MRGPLGAPDFTCSRNAETGFQGSGYFICCSICAEPTFSGNQLFFPEASNNRISVIGNIFGFSQGPASTVLSGAPLSSPSSIALDPTKGMLGSFVIANAGDGSLVFLGVGMSSSAFLNAKAGPALESTSFAFTL